MTATYQTRTGRTVKLTVAEARRLARGAREHGYHDTALTRPGEPAVVYVHCPLCRSKVTHEYRAIDKLGVRLRQLDAQVMDHLVHDCERVHR